jgi:maleate isomerase
MSAARPLRRRSHRSAQHEGTSVSAPAARAITGRLSGRTIALPDVNTAPMPELVDGGVIVNGKPAVSFGTIAPGRGYPDARSFRRKFALLLPATNTSMEHDLWRIVFANPERLAGIGLHTTTVATPSPQLANADDLANYRRQFLGGLRAAADMALLAQPEYMIMGMSLEHILAGLDEVRAPMAEMEKYTGLAWAAWHDAIDAALRACGARRIGLLTPFDSHGNASAIRMFEDLGYDVVTSVGLACANALHIAHVPDWAKERAIVEHLATDKNRLDAVVQCGTNMSLIDVTERLEPMLGLPILGINPVTFWYALRENGFAASLQGGGRLLSEH